MSAVRELKPAKKSNAWKKVDMDQLVKLCALQCTEDEAASFFGVRRTDLRRAVQEAEDCTFGEFREAHSGAGKISIRRKQFELAMKGDKTMLVWLGKNWLGQTDKLDQRVDNKQANIVQIHVPDNGRGPAK